MKTTHASKRSGARGGMTLLEVMVGMAILATAYGAFSLSIVKSMQAARTDKEMSLATAAARQTLAEVQASAFDQVFALYNSNPADDPGGAGTAPGSGVLVLGLDPQPGDLDGFVGEVIFPSVTGGVSEELREDVESVALGTPRDLNGDGAVDALDHSGDYQILPVVVRFRWQGAGGPASVEFRTSVVNQ